MDVVTKEEEEEDEKKMYNKILAAGDVTFHLPAAANFALFWVTRESIEQFLGHLSQLN